MLPVCTEAGAELAIAAAVPGAVDRRKCHLTVLYKHLAQPVRCGTQRTGCIECHPACRLVDGTPLEGQYEGVRYLAYIWYLTEMPYMRGGFMKTAQPPRQQLNWDTFTTSSSSRFRTQPRMLHFLSGNA